MTTIIMAKTDNFSIIMSDTRENYEEGSELPYKDGVKKLYSIESNGMGFITGAGTVSLLTEAKRRIREMRNIHNINEINNVFKSTVDEFINSYPKWANDFRFSYIAYSWYGENQYNINLLSESYLENSDSYIDEIQSGKVRIIYPSDVTMEEKQQQLNQILEKQERINIADMSLTKALYELLRIFKDISAITKESSSECEIGIFFYSKITESFQKEYLTGDVNKLLSFAQKNKILNKFKEVR